MSVKFFKFLQIAAWLQLTLLHQSYLCKGEPVNLTCTWNEANVGKLVPYNPGTPLTNVSTAAECRNQCTGWISSTCAAVNYKQLVETCELLSVDDQVATVSKVDDEWVHFVRPLCAGIWLPWNVMKGQRITGASFANYSQPGLNDCQILCIRDPAEREDCRSVTFNIQSSTNNCELNTRRAGDPGVSYDIETEWQTFSRPIWYLETSNGSSEADIRDYGEVGTSLHIFPDYKLPANGYLVGWKFFFSGMNASCPTFAAIWRRIEDSTYKLISKTLLSSQGATEKVALFQFIQNKAIRVEEGDVLSMFTHTDLGLNCSTNAISTSTTNGSLAVTFPNIFNMSLPDDSIMSTANPQLFVRNQRTPALKAFVAEYLSLKSAPLFHHNGNLTNGQIWLRLPPPLSGEDSVVVAGYRIVCSTDHNLIYDIACYNDLVSVNAREVLLTLSDVTKPIYAAVQVVRNFNGEELRDNAHSPPGGPACPDRNRTTNVNINEQSASADNENAVIEVEVLAIRQLSEDRCATAIKLVTNSSGHDSEYRSLNESRDQLTFDLTLRKDVTHNLKVYLKLLDGYEIIFWESNYLLKAKDPNPANNTGAIIAGVIVTILLLAGIAITLIILHRRGIFRRDHLDMHIKFKIARDEPLTETGKENGKTLSDGMSNSLYTEFEGSGEEEYINLPEPANLPGQDTSTTEPDQDTPTTEPDQEQYEAITEPDQEQEQYEVMTAPVQDQEVYEVMTEPAQELYEVMTKPAEENGQEEYEVPLPCNKNGQETSTEEIIYENT